MLSIPDSRFPTKGQPTMEWKLEVVVMPVADLDRAKHFYAEQVGFVVDHDTRVNDDVRVIQLTPPGSGCSIVIGTGIADVDAGLGPGHSTRRLRPRRCPEPTGRAGRRGQPDPARWPGRRLGRRTRRALELVRVLQRPGRQRLGGPGGDPLTADTDTSVTERHRRHTNDRPIADRDHQPRRPLRISTTAVEQTTRSPDGPAGSQTTQSVT